MSQILQKTTCLLMITGLFFLAGCATTRLADLTIVSTRNVKLDKIDLDAMPQTKSVVGKDSNFIFLFIPFGTPHLEDAIDNALDKGNGDVMIDAVVYGQGWWFLVGQDIIKVKGTVVKTRGTSQTINPQGGY